MRPELLDCIRLKPLQEIERNRSEACKGLKGAQSGACLGMGTVVRKLLSEMQDKCDGKKMSGKQCNPWFSTAARYVPMRFPAQRSFKDLRESSECLSSISLPVVHPFSSKFDKSSKSSNSHLWTIKHLIFDPKLRSCNSVRTEYLQVHLDYAARPFPGLC